MAIIDISGINKAELLIALFNNAKPLSLRPLTYEEANDYIAQHGLDFDHFRGVSLKVDIQQDTVFVDLYDRDHGLGEALKAIQKARYATKALATKPKEKAVDLTVTNSKHTQHKDASHDYNQKVDTSELNQNRWFENVLFFDLDSSEKPPVARKIINTGPIYISKETPKTENNLTTTTSIDISKIDKAELLIALHNQAKALTFSEKDSSPLTRTEAIAYIAQNGLNFTKNNHEVKGKLIPISLEGKKMYPSLYDYSNSFSLTTITTAVKIARAATNKLHSQPEVELEVINEDSSDSTNIQETPNIDISGIDKAELLRALYTMAAMTTSTNSETEDITRDEAIFHIAKNNSDFTKGNGKVKGEIMLVNLKGKEMDPYFYNLRYGPNAAQTAVEAAQTTTKDLSSRPKLEIAVDSIVYEGTVEQKNSKLILQ